MVIATLLVHVEADSTTDSRLELAVDLANSYDAKLIGVGAELQRIYGFAGAAYDDGYGSGAIVAAEIGAVEADLKRAEEKFRRVAAGVRQGSDWRAAVQFPPAKIAAEARAADLVITSRSHRQGSSDYQVAAPGALILQVGRPVLVVPPEAKRLDVNSVLVAWKETREARRAVYDALPFLQSAEKVKLVEVCDSTDAAPAATKRLKDVLDYLSRHGVTATVSVHVEEKDATAPHQLLDLAALQGADLIVAGGFGHSRLQEWVFGGFTRALLVQTERAVLFSH